MSLFIIQCINLLLVLLQLILPSSTLSESNTVSYQLARNIRSTQGHEAAVPLYKSLLLQQQQSNNTHDYSAASRIAASISSPKRHDRACPIQHTTHGDILKLREILIQSKYDNQNVQKMFGVVNNRDDDSNVHTTEIQDNHSSRKNNLSMLGFAQGPVYITPVSAGSASELPSMLLNNNNDNPEQGPTQQSSLECLVALFLLGFTVPREILVQKLIGGHDTISLLEQLGLAFPCELDQNIIVPYVHIFPLDVKEVLTTTKCDQGENKNDSSSSSSSSRQRWKSIVLVTDLHPNILSLTQVGTENDGTVMYIGPDSLALVQHIPLQSFILSSIDDTSYGEQMKSFRVLDFCTGSGIQAISTLVALHTSIPNASAVCVDINKRALRFTKFNAILNGINESRVTTFESDLLQQSQADFSNIIQSLTLTSNEHHELFRIILANPPFIPVPSIDHQSTTSNDDSSGEIEKITQDISKRYGLFSSGGVDGMNVLRSIIEISPRLLHKHNGLLAVVTEFMNPPVSVEINNSRTQSLISQLKSWWKGRNNVVESTYGLGVLFTNQYPIPAQTYALRRADSRREYEVWCKHLESQTIEHVSPGLLFIKTCHGKHPSIDKRCNESEHLALNSSIVPKTKLGSIWTPFNQDAVSFTSSAWEQIISTSL